MTDPAAASAAPSRQRIAVVTTSYPTHPDDPSGHFVHAEVEALRAEGHEVAVLAPVPEHGRGRDMPGVRWLAGGTAFGAPGALPRLLARPLRAGPGAARFVWEARRALERLAPDRIVAHFLLPCAWPIAVPRSGVRALEAVAHGSDVRLVSRLPRRLRAAIAKSLAGADVRCVSEELRQELAAALGGALSIRVAPSPLVLPIRASRAEARAALGVPASERLIVIVGRLVRQKRIDAALRAARTIPDAKALVIGDGPERRALELAFPEATFVGHEPRSRALTWIAAADLLLSASRQEGAPSVVREARALGTPVLAVAAGDLEAWSRDDPELWVVCPSGERCAR